MKITIFAPLVLTLFFSSTPTIGAELGAETHHTEVPEVEIDITSNKKDTEENTSANDLGNFCFIAGTPRSDINYTVIRKLKLGKGTYGGIKDILPKFAEQARRQGADAIINYTGSQRFGFFPWRIVRPVVRGVAVKWSDHNNRDCTAIGGTTLKTILATDKPPSL